MARECRTPFGTTEETPNAVRLYKMIPMKTLRQKPSLLRANPILFSPLYLNAEKVSTGKLLALYRFAHLFFPQLGPSLVKTILDMEQHGERLSAGISPQEREHLIGEMEGLSMDVQYALKDGGQKMMEISIHIVPGEVLERARQGKIDLSQYQKLRDDLDKLIVGLIEKEVRRRFSGKVGEFFQTFLRSKRVPPFIGQLLDMGWINGEGQLLKDASIDDLLSGKYRSQFARLMPEELIQEGMQIRETIRTCFAVGADDPDSLIQDARKRHALLQITIRETRRIPPGQKAPH